MDTLENIPGDKEPSILSIKIAKTSESAENLNLKRRQVKIQPVISNITSIPSIAAFENLSGADSGERPLKTRNYCKTISVAKLTQEETCLGTSLVFEALPSARGRVKCNCLAMGNTCSCSHDADCMLANRPTRTEPKARPNYPTVKN